MFSALKDFTAPYSRAESWLYDRVIAPSVRAFDDPLLAEHLPRLPPGARVLEVGCGGGQLLAKIHELRPDLHLTGLDLSPQQIARTAARVPAAGAIVGSALDLPFPDADFDAVLSVASIKHWPDPRRGLEECVRVLGPRGLLLVVEVDRGCRDADVRRFVGEWRLPAPLRPAARHMFRAVVAGRSFDLDDTRHLAEGLQLEDICVERLPGTPAWKLAGVKAIDSSSAV